MTLYADLFRYGDLFLNLFRRELSVKYRGSVLGLGWTLVLSRLLPRPVGTCEHGHLALRSADPTAPWERLLVTPHEQLAI